TVLIQERAALQTQVRIHSKGADAHKTLWLAMLEKCIHQIPRGQCRVHKCTRKGFFHAGGEMVDNRNPCGSFLTVVAGEKIPCNKLDISSSIEVGEHVLEAAEVTRGPNEAT